MSDPWKEPSASNLPGECEVAFFVHLHLDTACPQEEYRSDRGKIYRIEGKSRPMLVIRRLPRREWGRRWFLAIRITSKGGDSFKQFNCKVQAIGDCLEAGKSSFLVMEPTKVPENLLDPALDRRRVKPFDPLGFQNVLKVVHHQIMKFTAVWPRATEEANR